jgi:hypothetical protein
MDKQYTNSGVFDCTKPVFVVGMVIDNDNWQLVGIFADEARAEFACRTPEHFYSMVRLNTDFGDHTEDFPNIRWPKLEAVFSEDSQ